MYTHLPHTLLYFAFLSFLFITEMLDNYFRKMMVDRKKLFEILKLCQIIHKVDNLQVDN